MMEFAQKTYAKKGQELVDMNCKAVDMGESRIVEIEVKPEWANLTPEVKTVVSSRPKFVREIADKIDSLEGDSLPLSVIKDRADCSMPSGTAAYEKRGVASQVPTWDGEKCIQCNQCAFVCSHAAIRPFLVNEEEEKNAPEGVTYLKANGKGLENVKFTMVVSPLDCTGCGVCTTVCPKACLTMEPIKKAIDNHDDTKAQYFLDKVTYK